MVRGDSADTLGSASWAGVWSLTGVCAKLSWSFSAYLGTGETATQLAESPIIKARWPFIFSQKSPDIVLGREGLEKGKTAERVESLSEPWQTSKQKLGSPWNTKQWEAGGGWGGACSRTKHFC